MRCVVGAPASRPQRLHCILNETPDAVQEGLLVCGASLHDVMLWSLDGAPARCAHSRPAARHLRVSLRHPNRGQRCVGAASDLTLNGQSVTNASTWLQMLALLREHGVTMIKPQEVAFCTEKGMPLIDVRTAEQYQEGFIEGAVNVPLYQPIDGWEPYKIARRMGYALFGVFKGTEPNPKFLEEALEIADPEDGVVLCCNLGGTLEPKSQEPGLVGIQSRSLVAAYELMNAGFKDIKVLEAGVNGWREAGRDLFVEETEDEAAE